MKKIHQSWAYFLDHPFSMLLNEDFVDAYLVAPFSLDQEQRPHRVAKHRADPIRGLPQDLQLLHGRRGQGELGLRPITLSVSSGVARRARSVGQ